MTGELTQLPEYSATMDRLQAVRHESAEGGEYWLARDIYPILGYSSLPKFRPVIERAASALRANDVEPSHHIARSSRLMGGGKGAKIEADEFFLSRLACYLVAMNGDPSKPEVAAAQAYFAIQTRRMEIQEGPSGDEKRLRLRDKVRQSFKRVSAVAQSAGVRSHMQGVFHDARIQGLYGMSLKDLKAARGLAIDEQIFDRAGPLELSANDFQMNLAADVIQKEDIRGEQPAQTKQTSRRARARHDQTQWRHIARAITS